MKTSEIKECYAVPGDHSIIDAINPETGLTLYSGKTTEQVQAEYPGAVRMLFDEWLRDKAARQHTPVEWDSVDEIEYQRMFEVLPPIMGPSGFMVSEPDDHDAETGAPRYMAYRKVGNQHFVASRPMTVAEFRGVGR